jgi:hypothetical protein
MKRLRKLFSAIKEEEPGNIGCAGLILVIIFLVFSKMCSSFTSSTTCEVAPSEELKQNIDLVE